MMLRQSFILLLTACTLFTCGKKKDSLGHQKVFSYNQAEGLSSLDPAFAKNQANIWAVSQLYNGLVELDDSLQIIPGLASSWKISIDGLAYTFHLRKNIHFHDHEIFSEGIGREVTAEDFVYSFKRIIDKRETNSSGAWIFNNKVLTDKNGNFSDTCFKAYDKYTLKIYLDKPFPPFMELLSMPYAFVVPKEAIEKYGKEFRRNPVGTGPFIFKSWDERSNMIFLKNKNYWKKDSNGVQMPYLDAVRITFIEDLNDAFRHFQQGKLSFLRIFDDNSREKILNPDGTVKRKFAQKFKIQRVPYLSTEYIGIQLDSKYAAKNSPLLNKKFRKALNYGINREELIFYLRCNVGMPGNAGIVPPILWQHKSSMLKGYKFDFYKAQQLLREAGYSDVKKIPVIKFYVNPEYKDLAEFIQKQWANMGVNVIIEVNNFSTHFELINKGIAKLFKGNWLGDYPDPENFLTLFYSKNFSPVGPNKTHFKNKRFDELYEKSFTIRNKMKRTLLYEEMDQIIIEESPVIFLFYDEILRATQKNVERLDINPMNILKLEGVDIKEKINPNDQK